MAPFASEVAREIDRLVIAGHSVAGAAAHEAEALQRMTAHPGLLNTVALLLLTRPITRDDLGRIVPYLPPALEDALIENNVAEGVVRWNGEQLALTNDGRDLAEAVVLLQESAVADMWQGAEAASTAVEKIAAPLVRGARDIDAPATPSAFALFADLIDRPTQSGRVLRAITAMRYWRADAHRAALHAVGLDASEAHALNRLWDAHRKVARVGQGRAEPGERGLAALETRGLAKDGAITSLGVDQREKIEADTDARTDSLYEGLGDGSRHRLLAGLAGLPG